MDNMNIHKDKDESLWEQWSHQQRMRVAAALDLYIYYLVKNFEARDLFDISVTTDEDQVAATMLETVRGQAEAMPDKAERQVMADRALSHAAEST